MKKDRHAKTDPVEGYVNKVSALTILRKSGPISVTDYQNFLNSLGFRCPGPRKAWNVLRRLELQGLVKRARSRQEVAYKLREREVRRAQEKVSWTITLKGQNRLSWLEKRLHR